nr:acyl-CoA thioesterase domain-containing protein [Bradyrhizobium sp. 153]
MVHISELLQLKPISDDIFVGVCHAARVGQANGGQITAHSVLAAGYTVDVEDLHSLHCYFLRPGRPEHPIEYRVKRVRDGRNFASRQVDAWQSDKSICTMICSFQRPTSGRDFQTENPALEENSLTPPDECQPSVSLLKRFSLAEKILDIREIVKDRARASQSLWVRVREELSHSSLTHAAALAYLSDLDLGALPFLSAPDSPEDAASLDHSLRVHRRVRADEWLQVLQCSPVVSSSRAFTTAEFSDRNGRRVASASQELLILPPRTA